MGRHSVPDRWLNYNPLGGRIAGTQFITFKCPLKEGLVRSLPEQDRFTTQTLMKLLPNLGLVIDLTNTDRYYNRQDFLGQGIRYEKIFCRGHEIPSQSVVDKFFSAVDRYLQFLQSSGTKNSNDKLIGVHCTHGLNRTGYLVCRYMIRRMGFAPEDAISAFEKARGYPMEREEYLKSLRKNEASPKSPGKSVNDESHSVQRDGSQNTKDAAFSDSRQANGFPDRRHDARTYNSPVEAQDMRTDHFVDFSHRDDFRRFPQDTRASSSGPYRDNRAGFGNNFPNSSRSFRAGHPYRWERDPEESVSRYGSRASRRFYEQNFNGNQGMGPRRFEHRARSSSSFFRDSVRHRNNSHGSNQLD